MFTGLKKSAAIAVRAGDRGTHQIAAPQIAKELRTGDSMAVNGCCRH
jgi:riboflavin synthase alpha subunit